MGVIFGYKFIGTDGGTYLEGKEKNLHLHSGQTDGTISGQNLIFTYGMRRCSIESRQSSSFRMSMPRRSGGA